MEIDLENVEFFFDYISATKTQWGIQNDSEFKGLNQYHHFKMDTFESALKIITPNCFMSSVDL